MLPTCLTIAGSDSSGGAGIQADLKTFMAHQVYGMSVITAITAQNTCGVTGIQNIDVDIIGEQMDAVFTDIFPSAVKIGMVSVEKTIDLIAQKLEQYQPAYVIVDPVMVSTSGHKLLSDEAIHALKERLLPRATLITPNLEEVKVLCGHSVEDYDQLMSAFMHIAKYTDAAILIKGGHSKDHANDYLYHQGEVYCFEGERIENTNTHGTGCTLSSAITAYLALGYDLHTSIKRAKAYITGALKEDFNLGKGSGPLKHHYRMQ